MKPFFHDPSSEFTLKGLKIDPDRIQKLYKNSLASLPKFLVDLESLEKINATKVVSESENRSVDHYSLRKTSKSDEKPNPSLEYSLDVWNQVNTAIQGLKRDYDRVIINGIGGSSLGPKMLLTSLVAPYWNQVCCPKIFFLDNTDPEFFQSVLSSPKDYRKTLFVTFSKSGSTAESMINLSTWLSLLEQYEILPGGNNLAVTTKGSKLDTLGGKLKFRHIFYMNTDTGGRTSLSSPIGMVPCAFAGLPFDQFLLGQSHMDTLTSVTSNFLKNPALLIALAIHYNSKMDGEKNMIVLGYSSFLVEYAHYLQQLYMESLGKEYTTDGFPCFAGQTVFGGVGTGEQHAFMQQVQKGLNDSFVRFISFGERKADFPDLKAGTMGRQLVAFLTGTQSALESNNRQFFHTEFKTRNAFNIGMMVALDERIVTFLAFLNQINAYDQPGVQDGKIAANSTLSLGCDLVEKIISLLNQSETKSISVTCNSFPTWDSFVIERLLSDMYFNSWSYFHNIVVSRHVINIQSGQKSSLSQGFSYSFVIGDTSADIKAYAGEPIASSSKN